MLAAAIQAFKGLSGKLKCQTMVLTLVMRGGKINLPISKDWICRMPITMWHYLEHDYTPLENLTYLKSIAKPSTTLVIEIPNFDSMSRRKYGENCRVGIHRVIFHYFLQIT
jgi:hypothetical protein